MKRAYNRRKTFGNAHGTLFVTKRRRCVRLTVTRDGMYSFVDLDVDEIDRLVRRLQSIKGGDKGAVWHEQGAAP
jgi:hypothetical protein